MTPPASATESNDSRALSSSSRRPATPPPPNASPTTSEALVVHLRYPTRHRRRWRGTNLLERPLGEVKRRTKVIGRFPGEASCLTLVWPFSISTSAHSGGGGDSSVAEAVSTAGDRQLGVQAGRSEGPAVPWIVTIDSSNRLLGTRTKPSPVPITVASGSMATIVPRI
jgi:Transposase, Mutator family